MAKKVLLHAAKTCGGEFEVEYTADDLPILRCNKCGAHIDDWVKWYQEYSIYWKQAPNWDCKKNHIICLLGYFVNLYESHYEMKFTFSLNPNGLFRGPEIMHLRRMYKMFDSDALLCKSYLEWIFVSKLKSRKRKITSLGFLATPEVVSEYKFFLRKSRIINRATPLPTTMLEWVKKYIPDLLELAALNDFGDLHVLLNHFRDGRISDSSGIIKEFVEKLKSKNYITDDYYIRNWSE